MEITLPKKFGTNIKLNKGPRTPPPKKYKLNATDAGTSTILRKKVPDYNTNVLENETSNFVYQELEGLPRDGWIHGCIFCEEITTRIENIFTKKAYICGRCSTHPYYAKFKKIRFLI